MTIAPSTKSKMIALLALASAPLAIAAPQAAFAQDTQAAAADENEGEIIVTARRREESLLNVPIAVTAISGDTLQNQGAVDLTVLQQKTPNLTMQIARGSNSTLIAFIRGVGQQDPLWGFEPGVGLYVDDVYVARPQGAVLDIFDIERVEVLRGPQGTLYGRNTIGGAVKYVTKKLGNEAAAKARISYGSYDQVDLVMSLTAPISDKLSVGAALARYKRDGYGTNLNTGAEHYDKDVVAARLSAEFTPSETVFFRLAADKTIDKSNPRHGHRETGNAGIAAYEPTASVYDTRAGIGDKNKVMTEGVSLTGEIDLNDTLTFKTISAYRDGHTDSVIDFDGTPNPTLDVPAFYNDRQFTQELQLTYSGERLQGVAGLFYLDARASGAFDTVLGLASLTLATSGTVKTKSYAAYTDLSYDLTDAFKVSAGLRYTKDDKTGTVYRQNFTGIRSPIFGNSGAVAGLLCTNYTKDKSFDQFTPRVSLSYQPNRDLNVYASYGKGFKSGGFDMRGDAVLTPTTVNGYNPETVDAFEAGLKGAFFDRKLFINSAAFFSNYKDQQVTIQLPAGASIASFVDNAGKAEIYGLELETRLVPSPSLSFTGAFGYTHADYKKFMTYIQGGTTPVDVSNQRVFQNTPKYSASLATTWTRDLLGGSVAVTPSMSYRSSYSQFEIPTPALDQKGYTLLDASIVWTSEDQRFQLSAHGRNLGNKRYRVGGYNFPGALYGNSVIGFYGPPRTYTVTAEVRF